MPTKTIKTNAFHYKDRWIFTHGLDEFEIIQIKKCSFERQLDCQLAYNEHLASITNLKEHIENLTKDQVLTENKWPYSWSFDATQFTYWNDDIKQLEAMLGSRKYFYFQNPPYKQSVPIKTHFHVIFID